jgi:hypothetical protein
MSARWCDLYSADENRGGKDGFLACCAGGVACFGVAFLFLPIRKSASQPSAAANNVSELTS